MGSHSTSTGSKNAMLRLSLRSVAAHKVRLALTILAVVLGTAFVSGSFMFTQSLSNTFDSAIDDQLANVDVVMSGEKAPMPRGLIDELREDKDHVAAVAVQGATSAVLATEDRKAIQTGAASPTIGIFYGEGSAATTPEKITSGKEPHEANEVLAPESAAELGIKEDSTVVVVDEAGQREVKVVGTYSTEATAHPGVNLLMGEKAFLDRYQPEFIGTIFVKKADGSSEDVVQYLKDKYPDFKVDTGASLAEELTKTIKKALSFVNYFLVAFGLIALLVGTFIIANTFSMIVAQRLKEFALMRALGVSRKQLTRSVVLEAVIVGIIGSAVGVVAGAGLVKVIQFAMKQFGMEIPNAGLGLSAQSILVPLALGTVVTIISAWAPARRAGAVRPVEAMRSTESSAESSLKARTIAGAVVFLIGCAAAALGAFNDGSETKTRAILVGIGALFVIVGVFLASPAISIPVVGGLGRIVGAPFKAVGKLAATNSRRNPRRTATTAFALTLGIALVTSIGMLSATMKSSISGLIDSEVKAEFILSGPTNGRFPVPAEAEKKLNDTKGVGSVTALEAAPVAIGEVPPNAPEQMFSSRLMSGNINTVVSVEEPQGDFNLDQPDVIVAKQSYLDEKKLKIGDTVPVIDSNHNEIAKAKVVGSFKESKVLGNVILSAKTLENTGVQKTTNSLFVNGDGSLKPDELKQEIEKAVEDFLVVRVQTAKEFAGEQASTISQMMNILYALLGLAVIVAVIGIINTLALNVIERRQEIGMLRAVGTQRGQIRTMISIESVQIALYGAVMGIVVGLGLGWSFLKVLSSQGLENVSVPWSQMVWLLVGSAVVGVIAAVWPARRAAKTPPLDAIAD